MASTKIINVLKDDSFSEILSIFKSTPADEVIFVLPKRSHAFQEEEHFANLRTAADDLGKTVSFLCSNADLNQIAKKHGFDVLLARQPSPRPKRNQSAPKAPEKGSVNMVNELEDFYEHQPAALNEPGPVMTPEIESEPESEPEEFEEKAIPIATRRMDDVVQITPDEERNVKIKAAREKPSAVDVHGFSVDRRPLEEIRSSRPVLSPSTASQRVSWRTWMKSRSQTVAGQRPRGKRNKIIGITVAMAVLAGIVVFAWSGSAQVTVIPRSTPLAFNISLSASDSVSQVDNANLKIPGQVFNIQKSVKQDFTATGQQDVAQKARGTLTVINKTSAPQQLIATTRFESADRRIYRSVVGIVVPAAKGATPGSATVAVVADKIGPEYNVPAGQFTIPAFSEKGDTNKFQNIYGQTNAGMHGGTSGKATVVSQADFDQAKTALNQQLQNTIQNELQSQINGLKVITDPQLTSTTPSSSAGPGDAATSFSMDMTGTLKTVGFRESDVTDIIKQYVLTKYNLNVLPEKLSISYTSPQFDTATNTLRFSVAVSGPGYANVDVKGLVTNLTGKNEAQIKAYLQGVSEISSANVILSPFWIRTIPTDPTKVYINEQY